MRAILVDNHPATLRGLRHILERVEEVEIVGEALGAEQALFLAEESRPDLVILDLELGEDSGVEACRELKSSAYPPYILFYTAHNSTQDLVSASLADADGYFYKGLESERLCEVVQRISEGERLWMLGPVSGPHAPA